MINEIIMNLDKIEIFLLGVSFSLIVITIVILAFVMFRNQIEKYILMRKKEREIFEQFKGLRNDTGKYPIILDINEFGKYLVSLIEYLKKTDKNIKDITKEDIMRIMIECESDLNEKSK